MIGQKKKEKEKKKVNTQNKQWKRKAFTHTPLLLLSMTAKFGFFPANSTIVQAGHNNQPSL